LIKITTWQWVTTGIARVSIYVSIYQLTTRIHTIHTNMLGFKIIAHINILIHDISYVPDKSVIGLKHFLDLASV
jgi:hypothetical protein